MSHRPAELLEHPLTPPPPPRGHPPPHHASRGHRRAPTPTLGVSPAPAPGGQRIAPLLTARPLHPPREGGPPNPLLPGTVPPRRVAGEGASAGAVLLSSCSGGIARPRLEETGAMPGWFGASIHPARAAPAADSRCGGEGMLSRCHAAHRGLAALHRRRPGAQGASAGGQKDGVSCAGVGTCRRGRGEHRHGESGCCRCVVTEVLARARPAGTASSETRHTLSPHGR